MIQFAPVIGLEVTLASYGLLEDFLFSVRGSDAIDMCGPSRRSPYPSVMGTTVGNSNSSQLRYSLPTVNGLTVTSVSELNASPRRNPVTESSFSLLTGVAEVDDQEDVPLVVLAQQERLKNIKVKKRSIEQCKLSREGRPNPIPRVGSDDGGGSLTRRCCRE